MSSSGRDCVLIIDDDEDIRSIYQSILEDEGYRTVVAEDGDAAIDVLQAEPGAMSLVMLDLMMPRLGGLGFLKRKAADPALAAVPVVIVSAITDLTPIPQRDDIKAILRKPVSIPDLLQAVRESAVRGPGPDDAASPQPTAPSP